MNGEPPPLAPGPHGAEDRRACLGWLAGVAAGLGGGGLGIGALGLGMGSPVSAASAAPAPVPAGDADALARFAAAVGPAAGASVAGFQRLRFPGVDGLGECWVGVGTVRGDPQAWLVPVAANGTPGAAIALPIGGTVTLLARLDLQGAPRKIDLTRPPGAAGADPAPGAPLVAPALLLSVGHVLKGGEERSTLVLVQVAPTPALRWQEIATSLRPASEGHRSFALELVADPGQPWLALHLYQTTVPAASGPPGQPGPPLRLRFGLRGGEYRRLG